MNRPCTLVLSFLFAASVQSCAPAESPDETATSEQPLRGGCYNARGPCLVQRGVNLVLWGVTDDNVAIFQDGATLYSTSLERGAERHFVADVPQGLSFFFTAGRVAFIWPQNADPARIAGPLYVFTQAQGARLASSTSVPASFGVAVSADNRLIQFITNANAEGTVGDIVSANVDLSNQVTLVANANVDYNNQALPGSCRPFLGFAGRLGHAYPVAAYCPAGERLATLSTWPRGAKRDLVSGVAVPPVWSVSPSGPFTAEETFETSLASPGRLSLGTPVLVNSHGIVWSSDATSTPGFHFLNKDGSVIELTLSRTANAQLRRTVIGDPTLQWLLPNPVTQVVAEVGGPADGLLNWHLHNGTGYYADWKPISPDGRRILYNGRFDATGASDASLVDVTTARPSVLSSQTINYTSGESFTLNSRFALYYVLDAATGLGALHAAGAGEDRVISTTAVNNYAAAGNAITFVENARANVVDLKWVDLGCAGAQPVTVARDVSPQYFPSHQRQSVTYSTSSAATPGLYVAFLR